MMVVAMTYSDDYYNCGISDDGNDDFGGNDHDLSDSDNGDDDYCDDNDDKTMVVE